MPHLFAWSRELEQVSQVKTDAGGAVHTPNLPNIDLDAVLGSSPLLNCPITRKAKIMSPYSGQFREAFNLRELLSGIIPDVTQKMLRLSDTIDKLADTVGGLPVRITSVGHTPHLVFVKQTLQARNANLAINEHKNQPHFAESSRGGSSQIAIVGMSSRLPGSNSVQEYWQSLMDQKRFIKEVFRPEPDHVSVHELTIPRFLKRDSILINGSLKMARRKTPC